MTRTLPRAPAGYRYLPQRNGKLAMVKMPTKPRRKKPYPQRRDGALRFAINLARSFDLWSEIGDAAPTLPNDPRMSRLDAITFAEILG